MGGLTQEDRIRYGIPFSTTHVRQHSLQFMPFAAWRSTLGGPTFRDLIGPMFFHDEYDNLDWFEKERPQSMAVARTYLENKIEQLFTTGAIAHATTENGFLISEFNVGQHGDIGCRTSEEENGDPVQTGLEQGLWLNEFRFRVSAIKYKRGPDGACEYEAEVHIVDNYGAQVEWSYGSEILFAIHEAVVGPKRDVILGRFRINGISRGQRVDAAK